MAHLQSKLRFTVDIIIDRGIYVGYLFNKQANLFFICATRYEFFCEEEYMPSKVDTLVLDYPINQIYVESIYLWQW